MMGTLREIQSSGVVVIYRSANGRTDWNPVPSNEVPEWVREPHTLGRLVRGEIAMDASDGDKGSDWYRAERVMSDPFQAKALPA